MQFSAYVPSISLMGVLGSRRSRTADHRMYVAARPSNTSDIRNKRTAREVLYIRHMDA